MPINLGAAAFGFGIDAANFVTGITRAGGVLAAFAAKNTESMAKSVKAYQAFSIQSDKLTDDIQKHKDVVDTLTKTIGANATALKTAESAYDAQVAVVQGVTNAIVAQKDSLSLLTKTRTAWTNDKTVQLSQTSYKQSIEQINALIVKQKEDIDRLTTSRAKLKEGAKQGFIAAGMSPVDAGRAATDAFNANLTLRKNKLKELVDLQKDQTKFISEQSVKAYKDEVVAQQQSLEQLKINSVAQRQIATQRHEEYSKLMIDTENYQSQLRVEQIRLTQVQQQQQAQQGAGPKAPANSIVNSANFNLLAQNTAKSAANTAVMMSDATKGFERFTRGLRGMSTEWAAQKEKVYQTEKAIAVHNKRVSEAQVAVESFAGKFKILADEQIWRTKQIDANRALEVRRIAEIAREQERLNKMIADGKPVAAITAQQAKIVALDASLKRLSADTEVLVAREKDDENQKKKLNAQYDTAVAYLSKLKDQQNGYKVTLQEAKAKLSEIISKQKEKNEKDKEAKKEEKDKEQAIKKTTVALDDQGRKITIFSRAWSGLVGLFKEYLRFLNPIKPKMDEISGSTQRLNTSTVNVTAAFSKMQMVMSTMAGSAIGTFLGNLASQLGSVSSSALDVYKSNELMQLSLTSMIAAQMANTGQFESVGAATATASVEAQKLDKWMKALAINSPFSQTDIKDGMQLGLALGFNVEQSKRLTEATTNWAAASGRSGAEMTQVTRAMGQMNASQRVTLEDLNQLTNVGIGWTSVLEKEFGPEIKASGKSLRDLISEGIVPADRAIGALTQSFEEDFPEGAKNAGETVTGLLASLGDIKDEALRAGWTGLIEAIKPLLKMFTEFFINGGAIDRIREFGTVLGTYVTQAVNAVIAVLPTLLSMWNELAPVIGEAISGLAEFARFSYDWGAGLIQEFSQGIMDNVQPIIDAVMWIGSIISEWLMPHSPPKILPDIDKWGASTIQLWADGMSKPDMSALADVGDTVRSILNASGSEESVAGAVIGSQEIMARAINEFKRIGFVSENTFTRLRNAAGSAGDKVEAYARAMFAAQSATKRVSDAQTALNKVTEKYDAILKPLNARLAAFQNKQEGKAIADEVKQLQEQLAFQNPEGMDFDKSGILARLEELDIQKQINAAEADRDKALDAATEVLTAAEKNAEQKQSELELIKEQIDFGNRRNELLRERTEEMEKQEELAEKASTLNDDAEKDALKLADAQFKAALSQATSAEKVDILTDRLAELEPGTIEYIKTQQELAKAQDVYNQELAKTDEAEFKLMLSRASATEQVQMYQDRLAQMTPGTIEYIKLQKELEKVQGSLEEGANKLSDAEFAAALASKDRAGKIELLKEQMAGMEEGSLDYFNAQKKLNALELAEQKAQDKKLTGGGGAGGKGGLPKGMLAGKPFEGLKSGAEDAIAPIKALSDTVGGVSKSAQGSVIMLRTFFDQVREYAGQFSYILSRIAMGFMAFLAIEKVVKPFLTFVLGIGKFFTPINLLALALIGIGTILRENVGGIQEILAKAYQDVIPIIERLKNTVDTITKAFESGNFDSIISTLQKAIPQLIQDFGLIGSRFIVAMQQWAAPFVANATTFFRTSFTLVMTAVSTWIAAGGIDGIWKSIQGGFDNGFAGVGIWMQTVGFEYLIGGWNLIMLTLTDQIKKNIPGFNEKLTEVGLLLAQGMAALVAYAFPYFVQVLAGLGGMIQAWVDAGGITNIVAALSAVFAQYSPGVIAGIGLLVTMAGTAIIDSVPIIIAKFQEWSKLAVKWMLNEFPTIMSSLGVVVGGLLAGLGKLIIASIPFLLKAFLELINRMATAIPGIVKFLTSAIVTFATWLLTDGIVEIVRSLAGILVVIMEWIGTTAPTLMYSIGNMLGDTFTKLFAGIVTILGYWVVKFGPLLVEGFSWIGTDLLPAIITNFEGISAAGQAFFFGWVTGMLSPLADLARTVTSDFVTNILSSLGISLDAGAMEFIQKWVNLFDGVVNAVKEALGIASPSTVFMEIGTNVVQGAIDGVNSLAGSLVELFLSTWNIIYENTIGLIGKLILDGIAKWDAFQKDFAKLTDDLKKAVLIHLLKMKMDALRAIYDFVEDGIAKADSFRDTVTTAFETVSINITTAISSARDMVGTVLEDLVGKAGKALEDLKKFFTNESFRNEVVNSAKNIGEAIIKGIIDGFTGAFESLKSALLNFLQETVGSMLEEWKNNFFSGWSPSPPSSPSNGGNAVANGGGGDKMVASGGDNETMSSNAVATGPLDGNPRMVAALIESAKTRKPIPTQFGTPTYNDLAAFVRKGGKLSRGLIAAANNPMRWKSMQQGRNGPSGFFEHLDLGDARQQIEALASIDPTANLAASGNAMIASQTSNTNSRNETNNFNATFVTERDSMGLMNDFNIMKALRKV